MFGEKEPSFLLKPFIKPFHGLGFVVWLFFAWSFLSYPDAPLWQGLFYDSDDTTHLVRIIEWLNGQSWFDPMLYRLSPPEGVISHFSRLAELPLALLMLPFHAAGFSWQQAGLAAGGIYPLMLLAAFLWVLPWSLRPLIGQEWARFSCYVVLFASHVMFQFSPGRIDHHGLSLLLIAAAYGCFVRLMQEPACAKWSFSAGGLLALAQAVALETVPWTLAFAAWLGLWMIIRGRMFARAGMIFGLSYYVFSVFFLLLTRGPEHFFDMQLAVYSGLYGIFAAALAFVFIVTAFGSLSKAWPLRAVIGAGVALVTGSTFLIVFPQMAVGPYGGVDPKLYMFFVNHISEAEPFLHGTGSPLGVFLQLAFCFFGLTTALFMLEQKNGTQEKWGWFFHVMLVLIAVVVMLAYQKRYVYYAYLFCVGPLVAFARQAWGELSALPMNRKRFGMELGLVLLLGPVFSILLPGFLGDKTIRNGVVLFAADFMGYLDLPDQALWSVLNDPTRYGDRARVIMNSLNEGSAIMFYTKHKALAAPYHMNTKGNFEALAFFSATDDKEARKVLKETGAELVLLSTQTYAIFEDPFAPIERDPEKRKAQNQKLKDKKYLAKRLVRRDIPVWLKPVPFSYDRKVLLFEVDKSKL